MDEDSSPARQEKRTKAAADRPSSSTYQTKRRRLDRQGSSSTLGSLSQDIDEATDQMADTEVTREVKSMPHVPSSPDDEDQQTLTEMFFISSKTSPTGVDATKEAVPEDQPLGLVKTVVSQPPTYRLKRTTPRKKFPVDFTIIDVDTFTIDLVTIPVKQEFTVLEGNHTATTLEIPRASSPPKDILGLDTSASVDTGIGALETQGQSLESHRETPSPSPVHFGALGRVEGSLSTKDQVAQETLTASPPQAEEEPSASGAIDDSHYPGTEPETPASSFLASDLDAALHELQTVAVGLTCRLLHLKIRRQHNSRMIFDHYCG